VGQLENKLMWCLCRLPRGGRSVGVNSDFLKTREHNVEATNVAGDLINVMKEFVTKGYDIFFQQQNERYLN